MYIWDHFREQRDAGARGLEREIDFGADDEMRGREMIQSGYNLR